MRSLCTSALTAALAAALAAPAYAQQGVQAAPVPYRPLYNNPQIRQELRFTELQQKRLNEMNERLAKEFQAGFGRLNDLNEAERAARMMELRQAWEIGAMRAAQEALNEQQFARYRQLVLQSQGPGAFTDPTIAKHFNLTREQTELMRRLSEQAQREMEGLLRDADTAEAQRRYDALRRQTMEQMNTILNEQQQQAWREMAGDPFNFRIGRPRP